MSDAPQPKTTDLRPWHIAILFSLEEGAGWGAKDIGGVVWPNMPARTRSQCANQHCRILEKLGLVAKLDDQRPIAWMRTKAGTEALNAADKTTTGLPNPKEVADEIAQVKARQEEIRTNVKEAERYIDTSGRHRGKRFRL